VVCSLEDGLTKDFREGSSTVVGRGGDIGYLLKKGGPCFGVGGGVENDQQPVGTGGGMRKRSVLRSFQEGGENLRSKVVQMFIIRRRRIRKGKKAFKKGKGTPLEEEEGEKLHGGGLDWSSPVSGKNR